MIADKDRGPKIAVSAVTEKQRIKFRSHPCVAIYQENTHDEAGDHRRNHGLCAEAGAHAEHIGSNEDGTGVAAADESGVWLVHTGATRMQPGTRDQQRAESAAGTIVCRLGRRGAEGGKSAQHERVRSDEQVQLQAAGPVLWKLAAGGVWLDAVCGGSRPGGTVEGGTGTGGGEGRRPGCAMDVIAGGADC